MALQIFPGEGGGIYSSKFVVVRDKQLAYMPYTVTSPVMLIKYCGLFIRKSGKFQSKR